MNGIFILVIIALVLALVAGLGEIARLHKQLGKLEAAGDRLQDEAVELRAELDRAIETLTVFVKHEYDKLADECGLPE